jgi:superfamily I DNA/RNA helicase/RecB family exonuclease
VSGRRGNVRVEVPRPRLVRSAVPPERLPPAALDPDQAAAVGHPQGAGPLVLLGGPGTGTTTTLVEALVARVERDGVRPDQVLVLAPTRVAAAALRDRVSARIRRTVREPLSRTPHSYAFGLLRRSRVLDGDLPPQLISGPEQDRVIADLLAGHEAGEGHPPAWPASVGEQVRVLRGFRDELRDLMMRAVERGLAAEDLAGLGRSRGRPDWVAAAQLLQEYLDVTSLATPGGFDPAGIVDAAVMLLETDEELLEQERRQWAVIAMDDAQEATAATLRLLELLAGGGHDLVLAGDPDAATQTFRGARPRALAEADRLFRNADGSPATTVVLHTVHRHGTALRAVTQRVAGRIGSSGTVAHRQARPVEQDGFSVPGRADVRLLASPAQEAGYVAAWLRRLHLEGGIDWDRMAVVVRSAKGTDVLRRALGAAGVPVAVPAAEVPVRDEPAARPLRHAMRVCLDPGTLTPDLAVDLLTGPLGGADAVGLRRLRQALRAAELAAGGTRSSDPLLVEALQGPGHLVTLDSWVARPARQVAAVLTAGAAAAARPGATAEVVLWALWEAAGLADGWRRAALAGGVSGSRADRDLDAVVAMFEAAARYTDRLPHAGPADFLDYLEGQDLPADTLAERAPAGHSVALVTAQGAAGREWDVVAVVGVQEGSWPDLRLRSSVLGAQLLADLLDGRSSGDDPVSVQRREVLDDELRLFHVAVSRPRRQLLVTAVRNLEELPSPFVDLVDPDGADGARGPDGADGSGDDERRPIAEVPRTLALPALVAELRGVVVDAGRDADLRAAAAEQLARLSLAGVPGADPEDWYGLADLSVDEPRRDGDAPVRVSPSKVESFHRCALRWLLEQSGGTTPSSTAQGLGSLIHELAELVPDADEVRLRRLLDERFDRLGLGTGWLARVERDRAETMVGKLVEYVRESRRAGRRLLAVERDVALQLGRALVKGQVDRLEVDDRGRLVVVDLKTGKTKPSKAEVEVNPQLGVYQVLAQEGGFDDVAPDAQGAGGAILVPLGAKTKGLHPQEQPPLSAAADPDWARDLVQTVAAGMADRTFPATVNPGCRTCGLRRSCPAQSEGRQVGQQ